MWMCLRTLTDLSVSKAIVIYNAAILSDQNELLRPFAGFRRGAHILINLSAINFRRQ